MGTRKQGFSRAVVAAGAVAAAEAVSAAVIAARMPGALQKQVTSVARANSGRRFIDEEAAALAGTS